MQLEKRKLQLQFEQAQRRLEEEVELRLLDAELVNVELILIGQKTSEFEPNVEQQ